MQVDLEARGARDLEADTLPEASFEALSRLLVPAPSPTGAEQRERRVVVLSGNEQVDIGKRAKARLWIDTVRDCGASENPRSDLGRCQLRDRREQ